MFTKGFAIYISISSIVFSVFLCTIIGLLFFSGVSMEDVADEDLGKRTLFCWFCDSRRTHYMYQCDECDGGVCLYCGACYPSRCSRFDGVRHDDSKEEKERINRLSSYKSEALLRDAKPKQLRIICSVAGFILGIIYCKTCIWNKMY